MRAAPYVAGIALGLIVGALVMSLAGGGGTALRTPPPGRLLPDCEGRLRELVIQYAPEAAGIVAGTYRDFLSGLEADVTVHVVCPDESAFDDLARRVGPVRCTLHAVATHRPVTCWARDRWLALAPPGDGAPVVLMPPRSEEGEGVWPERAGDGGVSEDLAGALGPEVLSVRSPLFFDGGDFVADDHTVFVTPAVLRRNLQHTVRGREELVRALGGTLRRQVVLLAEAPPHHAGMFMMPVGERTVLVGDPRLARRTLEGEPGRPNVDALLAGAGGADFCESTQRLFDAVAARCAEAGYRVVRVPTLPARDGRTWLTYLNVILDRRGRRGIVHMPVYRGAEALNRAAAAVWQHVGYEVRPVDCTETYAHFGSLRCLVNVLRRGPTGPYSMGRCIQGGGRQPCSRASQSWEAWWGSSSCLSAPCRSG